MSLQASTSEDTAAAAHPDLHRHVHDAARRARAAARLLATLSTADKDRALHAAADALLSH
ncbi:MAG: gamma-glutamyl-phosphate reductase, partial [Mycobacteriaceae bacterium]|nr:gamma-glutamyl-phosphate reductase [Mycobacteriaceae bacterium]